MVERGQGDAQADARRLVHLAVDQRRLVDDTGLLHFEPHVGALTGALAHAGEHGHAAVLLGDAVDHLLDDDGLAHAGTAEEADLPTLHVGLQEVDHLDARLEHQRPAAPAGRRPGRERWISQRSSIPSMWSVSSGWPSTLKTWPRTALPTGTEMPRPRLRTAAPAHEPVGLLHADAADPPVTDLLGHFGRHGVRGPVELNVELDLVVDLGQRVRRELDVDHRSGDGDDAALFERASLWCRLLSLRWWSCGQAPFDWRSASAPPTISMISVVMAS